MTELSRVVRRRHLVPADPFGRSTENPVEVVVERKSIASDVILPVGGASHLQRVRELRLAQAQLAEQVVPFR